MAEMNQTRFFPGKNKIPWFFQKTFRYVKFFQAFLVISTQLPTFFQLNQKKKNK